MDRKLITLLALFFVAFATFTSIVVFNKPLTQLTRAKEESIPSAANSLILAWPLKVAADGKEKTTITVFARSTGGRPIPNKTIALTSSLGAISPSTVVSDAEGKGVFTLTSPTKGVAEMSATVDNSVQLNQRVSVKFE